MIRTLLWVVGLTLMWVALWGDLRPGTVVAGLLAAILVVTVVPRPQSDRRLVFRPLGAVWFVLTFVWQVFASTWSVALLVLSRHAREARGVIIEVELSPRAYAVRTLIAHSISLTPGTITVDVGPDGRTLRVHVIDAEGVGRARAAIATLERRACEAFAPLKEMPSP